MNPAFKIPLTQRELQLLGEITVIQGQIEYLINEMTAKILGKELEDAERLYGAAPLARRLADFKRCAVAVTEPPTFQSDLARLDEMIDGLLEPRNSFVHAVFGFSYPGMGKGRMLQASDASGRHTLMIYTNCEAAPNKNVPTATAYRTAKNRKRSAASGLAALCERFALASQLGGKMWHSLDPSIYEHSPWRDKSEERQTPERQQTQMINLITRKRF